MPGGSVKRFAEPYPIDRRAQGVAGLLGWMAIRLSAVLGVIGGLLFGAFLGGLAGLVGGFGIRRAHLIGGPGLWVVSDVRRSLSHTHLPGFVAGAVAALVGAAVGFLTGPFWFQFVGFNGGRAMGENLAERWSSSLDF
ncbi:MAG: hypothetical protein AB7S38_38235 [Vulcanimicrobiota bacterium]